MLNFTAYKLDEKGAAVESLLLVVLLAVLGIGYYFYTNPPQQEKESNENALTVPTDAIQISGCIPLEGEHWVSPEDLPNGPIYVTHNGEVIAIDFMMAPDEIPGEDFAHSSPQEIQEILGDPEALQTAMSELLSMSFDLHDQNYDHWDIHWTAPHPGFAEPHYDIHFYLKGEEYMQTVCPKSGAEDIYPPQLMEELRKQDIPGVPPAQPQ